MEHYQSSRYKADRGDVMYAFSIKSGQMASLAERLFRAFRARCTTLLANAGVRKLASDQAGSTMILFAVTLPIMLAAVGAAVDYGRLTAKRHAFQQAADAAALAAAGDLFVVTSNKTQAEAVAKQVAAANLDASHSSAGVSAVVGDDPPTVTVTVSEDAKLYFAAFLHSNATTRVAASATAQIVGSTRICVLALDGSASGTFSVETKARITANGCALFSNSTSSQSMVAKNSAAVKAALSCAAGGVMGEELFEPTPLTDCPKVLDPLADRPAPPIGGCNHSWLAIEGGNVTLSPGVYCGGISITGGANVTFNPGVYIIKDGPLIAAEYVALKGENVGFYLTGSKALFKFTPMSTISLTAPKDGPLTGLLFFEDGSRKTVGTHYINSNDARLLLGTIYLPASRLIIDANAPVADQSAYTAIVVKHLKLYDGPHLILNTDYGSTDIPVPAGIKGTGNAVALTN